MQKAVHCNPRERSWRPTRASKGNQITILQWIAMVDVVHTIPRLSLYYCHHLLQGKKIPPKTTSNFLGERIRIVVLQFSPPKPHNLKWFHTHNHRIHTKTHSNTLICMSDTQSITLLNPSVRKTTHPRAYTPAPFNRAKPPYELQKAKPTAARATTCTSPM